MPGLRHAWLGDEVNLGWQQPLTNSEKGDLCRQAAFLIQPGNICGRSSVNMGGESSRRWRKIMLQTILAYALIGFFFAIERNLRQGQEANRLERGTFDRGSTMVIGVSFMLTLLSLLMGLVLPQSLPAVVRWSGLALMIGGLALRGWSLRTLGRFYTRTLRITEEHTLVKEEPYTHIRHPGYLGALAMWIGAALATGSVLILAIVLVAMGCAYAYRIRTEESMLIVELGDQYESYRAKTWRLIPLIY
jgi:protein-S-isoprenylcysteine O-methyltransferase Ste14